MRNRAVNKNICSRRREVESDQPLSFPGLSKRETSVEDPQPNLFTSTSSLSAYPLSPDPGLKDYIMKNSG
jgi:hypothetical protein